jgi:quinoprotein glucose dehydrogenase
VYSLLFYILVNINPAELYLMTCLNISSKLFLLLSISLLFVISCRQQNQEDVRNTWRTYSADKQGSKYSSLDEINKENVQQLEVAWIYHAKDMQESPPTTIECNPIIINNMMVLSTPALKVVALNAVTGKELWAFDPYQGKSASGANRGVTYWESGTDKRIFYVAGSTLYGLNASTGELISSFGANGKVDLYEGLGRDERFTWVTAVTPGIIYKDILILGSTLGEGPGAAAPGHIRAYDVRTGQMKWIFHTIPYPGEFGYDTWPKDAWERVGGANAWGGSTLDEGRGIVYCGTGSPTYDHYGGDRPGQNLFANCILALNAETGERVWHYQVVHHDIWDYDIPCAPNLVTIERDGKLIDALVQPTKMGHLFVLNRETGEPLFPIDEVAVPASDIPGEKSWPTQPFPPKSLRYAGQEFTEKNVTDLSPEASAYIRDRIKSMRQGALFTPPSFEGSVMLPQFNGGTDWGGAAYDPESHTLYVNCSNEAEWISMVEFKPGDDMTQFALGQRLYSAICSSCHGFESPRNPGSPSLGSLRGIATKRGKDSIQHVLLNGKNLMPKFAMLSQEERDGIMSFLFEEDQNKKIDLRSTNLSFSAGIPYVSTGHRVLRDPNGFPANRRPWGMLSSINLDLGNIIWQVPLGTYPELEKKGYPPTGTFNMGGAAVTAGGLVFIGASMDERFHAYDKDSGKLLWEFQMEAGGYATPSVYQVNGKEYVVIAAGGGGKPETRPGDAYYCFTLPAR